METEVIKGLTSGEITGGTFIGAITVALGVWLKNRNEKKAETSVELELRLLKFLSVTVMETMEKMSKEANASNEKMALLFIKHLENSKESQAIINESFKSVYKKIDTETKKIHDKIEHTQDHWVHENTFAAAKENWKNKN